MIDGRHPRVASRKEHNVHLAMDQRVENLEYDSVTWGMVIKRLVEQNEKVDKYIDARIKKEENEANFWRDQRSKVVTAGIIATFGIIASAIWFTITHSSN